MKRLILTEIFTNGEKYCSNGCQFFDQPGGYGSLWAICRLYPNKEMGLKPNLLKFENPYPEREYFKPSDFKWLRHKNCINDANYVRDVLKEEDD